MSHNPITEEPMSQDTISQDVVAMETISRDPPSHDLPHQAAGGVVSLPPDIEAGDVADKNNEMLGGRNR